MGSMKRKRKRKREQTLRSRTNQNDGTEVNALFTIRRLSNATLVSLVNNFEMTRGKNFVSTFNSLLACVASVERDRKKGKSKGGFPFCAILPPPHPLLAPATQSR